MDNSKNYNKDQLFLLWILDKLDSQNIHRGPFYIGNIFESINQSIIVKDWISELINDELI